MKLSSIVGAGVAVLLGALTLLNASWLAPMPQGQLRILAHRGVHQTFSAEGLSKDTCTATRINPPTNPYLENTVPSMAASFAAGASVVELDIHPTTDGEFAVFHDWTLECRTNGQGVTRDQAMSALKKLDVGYGYTADQGRSHPFRGKGVGLMPTLDEVFQAFPDRQFLINIKSNDPTEADRLIAYLKAHGRPTDHRLWIWADGRAGDRVLALAPRAMLMSKTRAKDCAAQYLAMGWSGYMPRACHRNFIVVPLNLRRLYWGWPNRLIARADAVDSRVMIVGPVGKGRTAGLTHARQLDAIPDRFSGVVLTDEIETIGPAGLARRPTD
ncbi:glycerophosphodiester phosphodiesterase family protein [Caulobacter segnis]